MPQAANQPAGQWRRLVQQPGLTTTFFFFLSTAITGIMTATAEMGNRHKRCCFLVMWVKKLCGDRQGGAKCLNSPN